MVHAARGSKTERVCQRGKSKFQARTAIASAPEPTQRLVDSVSAILCAQAYDLKQAHTVDGEWPENEVATKAECEMLLEMASELRALKPKIDCGDHIAEVNKMVKPDGRIEFDQVAMDTMLAISNIDPDELKGGVTQAKAQAQCLIIDAMGQAYSAARAQGNAEPVAHPCWSCGESVSFAERTNNDGDCPHCGVELHTDDWPVRAQGDAEPGNLSDYDAGYLNDWGGGNVGWWQDYIRAEVERSNEFWRDQIEQAQARVAELESTLNNASIRVGRIDKAFILRKQAEAVEAAAEKYRPYGIEYKYTAFAVSENLEVEGKLLRQQADEAEKAGGA